MSFTLSDITNSYVLGQDGEITIGGEKLGGYKSGSLSFSAETVDNSTRDDQGWAKQNTGKRSASLSVTYNRVSGDPCQEGLISLFLASNYNEKGVEVKYYNASGEASAGGFSGVFVLTSYSEAPGMDSTAVECQAQFESWGPIVALPGSSS